MNEGDSGRGIGLFVQKVCIRSNIIMSTELKELQTFLMDGYYAYFVLKHFYQYVGG